MVNRSDFFPCLMNQEAVVNWDPDKDKTFILAFKKRKRLKGSMRFQS